MTSDSVTLAALRSSTAAFIADDPTIAQLIPVTRVDQSNGGFQEVAGAPRAAQTFKLSLLSYDQRPTITIAGVERIADYHIIGPHDMAIAVGDYWIDADGTRYDVLGFSEGWDHMTKAFISRHIPRGVKP